MEVALGNNSRGPFQREVREWQHVDPNTGALLTGRLEADRWVNGPLNTYGKMISQNLSTADGTQHTQKKQMEILQARTSAGSLQVVRSQTVQTSSSRWSSSSLQTDLSNGISQKPLIRSNRLMNTASNLHNNSYNQLNHETKEQRSVDLLQSNIKNPTTSLLMPTKTTNKFSNVGVQNNNKHMDLFENLNFNERETIASESFLTRGKSISIEDLSTERNENNFDDDVEPTQWKRVSKIRRSLQFPRKTTPKISTRPADLPENSVSVLKIKQELENGRRLNTAMRNNHIDFVALDNILKSVAEPGLKPEQKPQTKSSFLTAESLKEIRGKLRRLSNESLYKEDMSPVEEDKKLHEFDSISEIESSFKKLGSDLAKYQNAESDYKSKSLETNKKVPDPEAATDDWHSRRKSYGFEKMSQSPSYMVKMDSSTDSGIGRSTDLSSSWPNPGSETTAGRGTIVTLGEQKEKVNNPATIIKITTDSQDSKSFKEFFNYKNSADDGEVKRHSIAVDETSYVRDSLKNMFERKTSVHLNGLTPSYLDDYNKNKKKVEFCKTEVHFAADSGRVNIVETDEKPPPTNNFRRRRRTSGGSIGSTYLLAINAGVPVTHFGDLEKQIPTAEVHEIISAPSLSKSAIVTTSIGKLDSSLRKASPSDESDGHSADEISLRGILKNKPVKPKPYHLGDNLENSESLWGVKLRPVSTELNYWSASDLDKKSGDDSEKNEERKETNGNFSTKINLTQSPSFSWQSKDKSFDSNETQKSTTKILIDMTSAPSTKDNNGLKSTSLIMKTMRSANQFDEAMKKLESTRKDTNSDVEERKSAFQLVGSSIIKSNSASSIYKEKPKLKVAKYAASLDGDVDDQMSYSHNVVHQQNFKNETRLSDFEAYISKNTVRGSAVEEFSSVSMVSNASYNKPIAAPRMKKLGSNVLSHQLSQLKRLYDAAEQGESDDSAKADEEVKLYLGNLGGGEEKTSELSGSWSRIKAKRNTLKLNSKDQDNKITVNSNSEFEILKSNEINQHTSTNVMSIALKSPTGSLKKQQLSPMKVQHASPVETPQSIEHSPKFKRHIPSNDQKNEERASLKLSSGTRQLRDHELSFFGVNSSSKTQIQNTSASFKTNSLTSSFIRRSFNASNSDNTNSNNKSLWQLTNDKPDLIKHSQNIDNLKSTDKTSDPIKINNEPHYENIMKAEVSYNRQMDLERDEKILEELTRAADEILNVVNNLSNGETDEEIFNESKSHNVALGTISESSSSSKIMKSKAVQVSKNFEDSLRRYHRPCRVSSASSNESVVKMSTSAVKHSSVKSVKSYNNDSHSVTSKTSSGRRKVTTSSSEGRRLVRVSSKDKLQSQASSSEDLATLTNDPPRRPRRSRHTKEKERSESSRVSSSSKPVSESRRVADERTSSSRSHKTERSSTRTSKGLSSAAAAPTVAAEQQRTRSKSGATVLTTTSSKRMNHHR